MQPSLPLFPGDPGPPKGRRRRIDQPDRGDEAVFGLGGFLIGDEVRVDGLRGRFRCRAFTAREDAPTVEVFGPLPDGRASARVPSVRTFPLERLRAARRRKGR